MTASPEIKALTSLRGIAAILVLFYHVRLISDWYFWLDSYTGFFEHGYLWVDFFFILSGFILAYVYGDGFRERWPWGRYLDFLRRRLLRIYPLHLFVLLLFIPLVVYRLVNGHAEYLSSVYLMSFVEHLLLVQSWYHHHLAAWNAPSWSISSEWAAYLLFPFFFWMMMQRCALLVVVAGVILVYVMSISSERQNLDILHGFGTLRCFAEFSLGIFVHRLYRRGGQQIALFGRDSAALAIVVSIVLLLHSSLHDIWLVPAFAALILAAALNQGVFKRILEARLLYHFGLISYSLYMTHWLVFQLAVELRLHWFEETSAPLALALLMTGALLLTWLFSIFSYRHVEERFRRGLRWTAGRSASFHRV